MDEQYYLKVSKEERENILSFKKDLYENTEQTDLSKGHVWILKRGQLVPYHTHPTGETVVVLKGSIRYIVEEDIIDLQEGDAMYVNANAVHAALSISEDSYSEAILIFKYI